MLSRKFWKKYFKVYDFLNKFVPYQDLLKDIVENTQFEQGDLVLDAGSGTGTW